MKKKPKISLEIRIAPNGRRTVIRGEKRKYSFFTGDSTKYAALSNTTKKACQKYRALLFNTSMRFQK